MGSLLTSRFAVIGTLFEAPHHAQGVGANAPNDAGTHRRGETATDAPSAGIKQSLPPAVTMILDTEAIATVLLCAAVIVAEPRAILEGQTADPFVLDLGKRLNAEISIKTLLVLETGKAVVAFANARHADLELTDAAGNADIRKRSIIPVKHHALTRTAGVETVVAGEKVVLSLRSNRTRTLSS